MKPKNTNPRVLKEAYTTRLKLREELETKVAKLSPILNPDRCRQLIGQLNRLDKKISEYEKQNAE